MAFDFALLVEQCSRFGWSSERRGDDGLAISLEPGSTLLFMNDQQNDSDSLMGFDGYAWHTHGTAMFSDPRGFVVELEYTDILPALAAKSLLICELWERGKISDRWLTHRDYVSDLKHMQDGDEIRVRSVHAPRSGA